MSQQYRIKTKGEEYKLNLLDRLVLLDTLYEGAEITYAGKPTENVLSFIFNEREFMFTRTRGNIYIPQTQKILTVQNKVLELINPSNSDITIRYISDVKQSTK